MKEIILNRGLDLFVKEEECEPLQHVITSPIPVPQTVGKYLVHLLPDLTTCNRNKLDMCSLLKKNTLSDRYDNGLKKSNF